MTAKNKCRNCSSAMLSGREFCDECGMLHDIPGRKSGIIECEQHPGRQASGICVVCSKPLCSQCAAMAMGRMICQYPDHGRMLQEWNLMVQLKSEFEADALIRNLADGGVEARAFALHDHIAAHGISENRVCLFVKNSDLRKARGLLRELKLLE